MKLFRVCLIILMPAIFVGGLAAQSGRGASPETAKSNLRPAVAPTPTPQLSIVSSLNDPGGAVDDTDVIKVNTQLVSIPLRVMDRKGRFAAGLKKEDFTVSEDGREQEIAMFSNEHQAFTVALVLDMSYSTKFKIAEIQSAAIAFVGQLRAQDKVILVSFDGDVHLLCGPTNDREEIYKAIKSTKILPGTSLYEAVDVVINDQLRRIEGRKAIILFTDGVDTTSQRVSELNNLNDAMELDALIYPIRYDTYDDVQAMKNSSVLSAPPIRNPLPGSDGGPLQNVLRTVGTPSDRGTTAEDYRRAGEYLEQLANRTGGREYLANSIDNLTEAFSRIAGELREFYSIGYYPTAERVAGKKTTVKIRVDQPGLVVRARDGYLTRRKSK
jgi:Ca-activated chloride channel homolog